MDRPTKFAVVVLGLFSLPFCVFGLAALFKGIQQIPDRTSSHAWMLVPFGLVFSIIGFGLLGAVIFGPRKLQREQQCRTENPDQPWLWREDWAQGRALSQTKSEMIRAWIFSILWNLVSFPVLFVLPSQKLQQQPLSLIMLGFPMIGVALLVWALRETLRWFEFGKTYFEMESVPCVIGRELRGTIQTHFPQTPGHGIQLKLTCVHRIVTGSGKEQSTQEQIVWRDEKVVMPEQLGPGALGTSIPVSFHVPADAQPTDNSNPRNAMIWKLEADANVPGVDYEDIFELPVFRTKDSPISEGPRVGGLEPPSSPTIKVRPASDGGTEFYFPAARNKSFASSITGFSLIWGGVLWLIISKHAPIIFPLAFGFFQLLLLYGVLQLWLGTSQVIIGNGVLTARSGILGGGRVQEIPFSEIGTIQSAIGSQQGGGSGTPYYDIQLLRRNGMKTTLGRTIRDKAEADYLVCEMQKLIGTTQTRAASAGF